MVSAVAASTTTDSTDVGPWSVNVFVVCVAWCTEVYVMGEVLIETIDCSGTRLFGLKMCHCGASTVSSG